MTQVSPDVLASRQLSHICQTRTSEHVMGNAKRAGRPASFLEHLERKLSVLIAVPRAEGKMKASGTAALLPDLHHSSSVSIDTGIQTLVVVPSVFVSTSMPSVMLLSIRRLF